MYRKAFAHEGFGGWDSNKQHAVTFAGEYFKVESLYIISINHTICQI